MLHARETLFEFILANRSHHHRTWPWDRKQWKHYHHLYLISREMDRPDWILQCCTREVAVANRISKSYWYVLDDDDFFMDPRCLE